MKSSKPISSKSDFQGQEIVRELKKMGEGIRENFDKAWKSKERAKAEKNIKKGLDAFVGEVDKIIDQAKTGQLNERVQSEILKGLKKTNQTLGKMSKGWTQERKIRVRKVKKS